MNNINILKENTSNDEKIKKCLKSYLTGKKYFETDKNKAFDYFKQTLKYLKLIENPEKYKDLLNDTESECNKYITLSVEHSIENIPKQVTNINLFEIIEKGDIDKLKHLKLNSLNFEIHDEEGNTPLHKAVKYGDTTFLKACFKLGAPIDIVNNLGYTILEYACLEKDPNMINFLINNGANMKKHLFFRDGEKKNTTKQNYIDISIILKIIFNYPQASELDIDFLFNYFNEENNIGFDDYTNNDLIRSLQSLLNSLPEEYKENYIKIIREEIIFPLKTSLGCPKNKLELLLYNLVPFINLPFNLSIDWLLNLELKYFFIRIIKQNQQINLEEKKIIIDFIWDNYIKTNLLTEDYLGNLISQWILITFNK
jgi:hypothetical protein